MNEILTSFNDDVATLRRALVDEGLLTRHHGTYRRAQEESRRGHRRRRG